MRIGIGNDHSALEMKAEIIEYLQERLSLIHISYYTFDPEGRSTGYRVRLRGNRQLEGDGR